MCSEQPEISLRQLSEDQEYAFDCLQMLVSKLLARNELSREQAMEYCIDPRQVQITQNVKITNSRK